MKRQLPIIDVKGTAFYVDVLRDRLQQQKDPENTISFDVFEQDRDGYTFLYDILTKNVPEDPEVQEDGIRYVRITLSALMELDPEGIALKYHIPLEVLCPERAKTNYQDDMDEFYDDEIFY